MFISRLAYTAVFTRPADVTAYASGDLLANDTVAANVVPVFFRPVPLIGQSFKIRQILCRKSSTNTASCDIRLNLFDSLPTFVTAGDNSPLTTVVQSASKCIGSFSLVAADFKSFALGGSMSNTACGENMFVLDSAFVWIVPELRNAYGPGSAETFQFGFHIEY